MGFGRFCSGQEDGSLPTNAFPSGRLLELMLASAKDWRLRRTLPPLGRVLASGFPLHWRHR
jgi:hypothetical protein